MEPLIPVKAIAFDCFGTLVEIQKPSHPYRDIISLLPKHFQPPAKTAVMTQPWTMEDTVSQFGVPVDATTLALLQERLRDELASIACFPETIAVLTELKARGYRLAVCSNLALPYAAPVDAMLGKFFDAKVWSFEAGAVKPDRRIYHAVFQQLGLAPGEIMMVGDAHLADYTGARAAGMPARHLTRGAAQEALGSTRVATLADLLRLLP